MMKNKKFERVLVTGGAGFIGSTLTRLLLEKGYDVSVLDNLSMGAKENVPADARFIHADVLDEDQVRRSLETIDTVCHLAVRVSNRFSIH